MKKTTAKKSGGPGPKRRRKIEAARARANANTKDAKEKTPAPVTALTGKATRYLRSLGHHLDPVVQIGKDGITEGVIEATKEALLAHELIKVRVHTEAPVDRNEAGEELALQAGAFLAQTLGRTLLLYKRRQHKPGIVLPR